VNFVAIVCKDRIGERYSWDYEEVNLKTADNNNSGRFFGRVVLHVMPVHNKNMFTVAGDETTHLTTEGSLRVFVHLAVDKDADRWRRDRASGCLVGINDETPYGYGRAQAMGCHVRFSKAGAETAIGRVCRLGLRVLLGFDLIHAWRQRKAFAEVDVIWTHTESQYLAVASVLLATRLKTKLIGQTVWLMDRWKSLNPIQRILYRWLIARVDVMTFLSGENHRLAQSLFPKADTRIVPFGIPSEDCTAPRNRSGHPIRVLSLGNDRHRDWSTLIEATRDCEEFSVLILSGSVPTRFTADARNIEIRSARSNAELKAHFEQASVVCVPLCHNLHASGITVIQEAVLAGIPVVATDTGGLRLYFPADEVNYVPANDPEALRNSLLWVARNSDAAMIRAQRAQARMQDRSKYGANAYIRRHVEISRELVPA